MATEPPELDPQPVVLVPQFLLSSVSDVFADHGFRLTMMSAKQIEFTAMDGAEAVIPMQSYQSFPDPAVLTGRRRSAFRQAVFCAAMVVALTIAFFVAGKYQGYWESTGMLFGAIYALFALGRPLGKYRHYVAVTRLSRELEDQWLRSMS